MCNASGGYGRYVLGPMARVGFVMHDVGYYMHSGGHSIPGDGRDIKAWRTYTSIWLIFLFLSKVLSREIFAGGGNLWLERSKTCTKLKGKGYRYVAV